MEDTFINLTQFDKPEKDEVSDYVFKELVNDSSAPLYLHCWWNMLR